MSLSHKHFSSVPCIACGGNTHLFRDFGDQPLTNRFRQSLDESAARYSMSLGACPRCGLVQLLTPLAPELLKPLEPFSYREPEGHLDTLVAEIASMPGISKASRFCGVTYKDVTTLERLGALGYQDLTLFSAENDLLIQDDCAGLETIQARITPELAETLFARHGAFDVVIVRHLLEHAHSLNEFILAIARLIAPGGYVIFEVPDCTTMFEVLDYSFFWEEHVAYFTPATLSRTLRLHALLPDLVITYPYPLENSLVAVARHSRGYADPPISSDCVSQNALASVERYATEFPAMCGLWQEKLTMLRREGPIALLGAGHLAVTFINLLGVELLIDYVCDDAPDKVGRYIPGTQLRISPSSVLLQHRFSVCLMAVAPESEPKVLARNQEFIDRGGRFASIFPCQ